MPTLHLNGEGQPEHLSGLSYRPEMIMTITAVTEMTVERSGLSTTDFKQLHNDGRNVLLSFCGRVQRLMVFGRVQRLMVLGFVIRR